MTNAKESGRDIYGDDDFKSMRERAKVQRGEEFRLRALALIGLFRTGKRRSEVARLKVSDLSIEQDFLVVVFHISKTRKAQASDISTRREKALPLSSIYAQDIRAYWDFIKTNYPDCVYLFPSSRNIFTTRIINKDAHLSGRQLLFIIKTLTPTGWCHLFRETAGGEIARQEGNSITAIYKIKSRLDLKQPETAFHYINRYARDVIKV